MTADLTATTVETTITDAAVQEPAPQAAERVTHYTDGYAYEVPRPFLTLQQAAAILGKSMRSLERSLLGRWGNKLPEGWVARKMKTESGDEWRILPPPGFRVKMTGTEYDTNTDQSDFSGETTAVYAQPVMQQNARRKQIFRQERHSLEQPTIVIDRSEEVEHLLRELVRVQHALSEERRTHMEDLRMITQLQSSLRLLEVNAVEQAKSKTELQLTKQEMTEWRQRYERLVGLPWWKRLFARREL